MKELFEICLIKDINIDNQLITIINSLLMSTQLTNDEIKQILQKIIFFFNCFDTCNSIADTSILTNICCSRYFKTGDLLLLSICNITDEQMQFITPCKNKYSILQPCIAQEFLTTEEIDEIINNYKKNDTDVNNTKYVVTDSTSYNKLQPDTINLTTTVDSYLETTALDPEQIDNYDISKKIDSILNAPLINNNTEYDYKFAEWLCSPPTDINSQDTDEALALKQEQEANSNKTFANIPNQVQPMNLAPTQTNISDNSLTLVNNSNTRTIPSFDKFSSQNKMLDYFDNIITVLHTLYNVRANSKLTTYICELKTKMLDPVEVKDIYILLKKLYNFAHISLETGYNRIFDIADALIHTKNKLVDIKKSIMDDFIKLKDKQIQELAGNKNFYHILQLKDKQIDINFKTIKSIIELRIKNTQEKKQKIATIIDTIQNNQSRKYLIKKYVTDIFETCCIKSIDIDDTLIFFIKTLAKSKQKLYYIKITEILEKINFFLNCFDNYNTVIDTSILANIYCYYYGITNEELVESICDITTKEIQFIALYKSRKIRRQPCIYKGFPVTDASCSNPQPDTLDLTSTEKSFPTAINLDAEEPTFSPDKTKTLNPKRKDDTKGHSSNKRPRIS